MMTPEELAALDDAVAKMTPGEWFEPDGAGGDIWNNDAEPGERKVPDRVIFEGPQKPGWVRDRTHDEWLDENERNLAGIVALRNSYAALRATIDTLTRERDGESMVAGARDMWEQCLAVVDAQCLDDPQEGTSDEVYQTAIHDVEAAIRALPIERGEHRAG